MKLTKTLLLIMLVLGTYSLCLSGWGLGYIAAFNEFNFFILLVVIFLGYIFVFSMMIILWSDKEYFRLFPEELSK